MPTQLHIKTPIIRSHILSDLTQKEVMLKMECYQHASSFKIRGMGASCQRFVSEGKKKLFCSSGGNAGYAIAYAGRKLGAEVTVVVPAATSEHVRQAIKSEGAKVIPFGENWNDAHTEAMRLAWLNLGGYIHPFDNAVAWEGHSSLIDEAVSQCDKPDAIVLSVGGGGLFCGVMQGLQRHSDWRNIPVITAETEGAASLYKSIKAGQLICLEAITSVAVTLGVKEVAAQALKFGQLSQVTPITVTDLEAIEACQRFIEDHRVVVEPACGAALSVIYQNHTAIEKAQSVLVIVCGGFGVTPESLEDWKRQLEKQAERGVAA